VAVGVDGLLGTTQVVMKPLPAAIGAIPAVAGVCFDAEGNPQLVLDPSGLMAGAGSLRGSTAPAAPRAPARVLVVDDSLTTRMLEQSILEAAGYAVDVAVSGEEALEKARERRYALFVVDIEMPRMNGFEFIERTRSDPALHDIPSILVSSRSSPEDKRRGREAGARAYIVKSEFDETGLLQQIHDLIAA
jgi:two-component system chemotaxis sensor kinase CheA